MQRLLMFFLILNSFSLLAQEGISTKKERLDFANTYFEIGTRISPSFTGAFNGINIVEYSASLNPYLNWGGFHFWGHAEFYVSFPLGQFNFNENEISDYQLNHSVITGARYLPWAYQEKKIRPYVGFSWSALDFKKPIGLEDQQLELSKNFMWVPEAGFLYGSNSFSFRLGASYFYDNEWDLPVSKTEFEDIKTPEFNFNLGLLYAFEGSHVKNPETNEKWNSYPRFSKLSEGATKTGNVFVGVGPSTSFLLSKLDYNVNNFSYLNSRLTSAVYLDISIGYQLNKRNLFAALSFRNPTFETAGFGVVQTVKKTSLAVEVNKYLKDYSGFVPYIGLNLAYDHIQYKETIDEDFNKDFINKGLEPGLTFGWDILPGKTEEAIILRTNLRWYPFSSFDIDGKKFDFSQLEYNLIQVVIYPERFSKKN